MNKRIRKKKIKKIIYNYLKIIGNKFTISDISINSYGGRTGNVFFGIKEVPEIRIGIINIFYSGRKKDIGYGGKVYNTTFFFFVDLFSGGKHYPGSCRRSNDSSYEINDFMFSLGQCVNDFAKKMKDDDESEEAFLSSLKEEKLLQEEYKNFGTEKERYIEGRNLLKHIIKNNDYDKIPILLIKEYRSNLSSNISPFALKFFPNWEKCSEEYLDDFEKQFLSTSISNYQWRKILDKRDITRKSRKEWKVYTKEGETSLFKLKNKNYEKEIYSHCS